VTPVVPETTLAFRSEDRERVAVSALFNASHAENYISKTLVSALGLDREIKPILNGPKQVAHLGNLDLYITEYVLAKINLGTPTPKWTSAFQIIDDVQLSSANQLIIPGVVLGHAFFDVFEKREEKSETMRHEEL
jgi:hypothetical protein